MWIAHSGGRTDLLVAGWMRVDVIFGAQQGFNLRSGRIDVDPPLAGREANPAGVETKVDQPAFDDGYSVLAGSEVLEDAIRRPVVAVLGRTGVRNGREDLLELVGILLCQANAKREDLVGL